MIQNNKVLMVQDHMVLDHKSRPTCQKKNKKQNKTKQKQKQKQKNGWVSSAPRLFQTILTMHIPSFAFFIWTDTHYLLLYLYLVVMSDWLENGYCDFFGINCNR